MNCNNIINSIDKTFCELTNGYEINKEYFNTYLSFIYNDSNYYNQNNQNNENNQNIYFNTNITNFSNNILVQSFNYYSNSYYNTYSFLIIMFTIFFCDKLLVYLFGFRARWFQLHSIINSIITFNIFPEFLNISSQNITPYSNFDINIVSYNSSFYIIALHLYHIISFKNLTFYDYFHHILFVVLGVVPSFLYLETNQYVMAYIACAGIPGIFEYGTLSLYKNDKISLLSQKRINSYLYIFFRYPLCVFGVTINYINYNSKILKDNIFITLYLNFLLYLNGSLFTFLTLDSYIRLKNNEKIKNSGGIIYSNKTIKCE
jgi:hypothetical protein